MDHLSGWGRRCVLMARRIRRTDLYASSSSLLAALLITIFEKPLVIRRAFLKWMSELACYCRVCGLFNTPFVDKEGEPTTEGNALSKQSPYDRIGFDFPPSLGC